MLNISRVRVFFEVARHGSFAGAADELNYTPSAVSHQVSSLERELGTRLINRAGRPWTLTVAGEQLYRRAEAALAELATAESELAAISEGETGTVRLGSVPSGLRTVVPHAFAAFTARHPAVELLLVEAQPTRILKELRTGRLDIGIIVTANGQQPPQSRTFAVIELIEHALMVAVPAGSRFARCPHVTLRQLRGQRWLLPSRNRVPEFRDEIDALFRDAGYTPNVALELDDDVAGQALIAAGVGIGLAPGLAGPHARPGVKSVPLRPKRLRALHAVTNAGPLSAPVATLLEHLQAAAAAAAQHAEAPSFSRLA